MKVLSNLRIDELPFFRVLNICVCTWIFTNLIGVTILWFNDEEYIVFFLMVALAVTSPTILFAIPGIYFLHGIKQRDLRILVAFLLVLLLCMVVILLIEAIVHNGFKMVNDIYPFMIAAELTFFLFAHAIIFKRTPIEYPSI